MASTEVLFALATLAGIPAATVYEAYGKRGDMSPEIRPMLPQARFAGLAYTLRTMPGNNEGVLRALAEAPAGSVLVIDAGGTGRSTAWGGTSSMLARRRGLVGCVTNGAVRDLAELRALEFPVFAAAVSVRGALKSHPGWHGLPVSVGGMVVCQDDLVVADEDGVVVVAHADIVATARSAQARLADEQDRDRRLAAGENIYSVFGLTPGRE
jgi:4-hydroxy-4-methyl-2-oxoglutarate aldolase